MGLLEGKRIRNPWGAAGAGAQMGHPSQAAFTGCDCGFTLCCVKTLTCAVRHQEVPALQGKKNQSEPSEAAALKEPAWWKGGKEETSLDSWWKIPPRWKRRMGHLCFSLLREFGVFCGCSGLWVLCLKCLFCYFRSCRLKISRKSSVWFQHCSHCPMREGWDRNSDFSQLLGLVAASWQPELQTEHC